jgi:hypothetical protein
MRRTLGGIVTIATLFLAPSLVHAQTTLGPTLAMHDDGDLGIGATLGAPMASLGEGIGLMADFLIFFPEVGSYFEVNANLTYDFPLENSTVVPFVLAGLNIGRWSVDTGLGSGSDTDLGLNVGGGIAFDAGTFRPSVAGRFRLGDGSGFVVFATLPFVLGS